MKIFTRISVLVLIASLSVSCLNTDIKPVIPIQENFFDWKTSELVDINIGVDPLSGDQNKYYRNVNIYSSPVYSSQFLMMSGSALPSKPFTCKLTVPSNISELYIEIIEPNGHIKRYAQSLNGIKQSNTTTSVSNMPVASNAPEVISVPEWKEIPTTFNYIIDKDPKSSIQLSYSNTYLVPEGANVNARNYISFSNPYYWNYKTANYNNAELYVKGKLTVSYPNIRYSTIIVLDGGELVVTNNFVSDNSRGVPIALYVMEGGKVSFKQGFEISGYRTIVNKGDIYIYPGATTYLYSFYGDGNASIYNTGTIHGSILGINDGEVQYNNDINMYFSTGSNLYNSGKVYSNSITMINTSYSNTFITNYESGEISAKKISLEGSDDIRPVYFTNYGKLVSETANFDNVSFDNFGYFGVGMDGNSNNADFTTDEAYISLYEGSLVESNISEFSETTIDMHANSIMSINKLGKSNSSNIEDYSVGNSSQSGYSLLVINENLQSLVKTDSYIYSQVEVWHKNLGTSGNRLDQDYLGRYDGEVIWVKNYEDRVVNIPASKWNKSIGVLESTDPSIVDKDGDGVVALIDIDDNDPSIAFRSYYPNVSSYGTILFEDLWPYIGDYDMNDLVCDYHIEWTLNAQSEVVYLDFFWKLRALGTTKKIAMAFQIDSLAKSNIKSVVLSNLPPTQFPISFTDGLENNQQFAVIPLFNDAEELFGAGKDTLINTIPDFALSPVSKHSCRVTFTKPISINQVMMNKINPFIVVSDFSAPKRNYEVHLPCFKRTSLASIALENVEGLSQNDPFLTNTGMMWGLMLPVSINYTIETVRFEDAYLKFKGWYLSNGKENKDWYIDNVGNIDHSKLYKNITE